MTYVTKQEVVNVIYYDGTNDKEVAEFCKAEFADNFSGHLSLRMSDLVSVNVMNESYIVRRPSGKLTFYSEEEFHSSFEKL